MFLKQKDFITEGNVEEKNMTRRNA